MQAVGDDGEAVGGLEGRPCDLFSTSAKGAETGEPPLCPQQQSPDPFSPRSRCPIIRVASPGGSRTCGRQGSAGSERNMAEAGKRAISPREAVMRQSGEPRRRARAHK
jgi:hypothetical protein